MTCEVFGRGFSFSLKMSNELQIWQDESSLAEIKKIFGRGLSEAEFTTLCKIGEATGLNPFLREIWAVKYGNSSANIFIGRDGYRKAAQNNQDYDYHISDAVYDNDNFTVKNGEVDHEYNLKDRGKIIGAYCVVKRKNSSKPNFVFVEFKEYKGKSVWETKPATMIKKVAEAQGLRMTFQSLFAGTYDESEDWKTDAKNTSQVEILATKEQKEEAKAIFSDIQKMEGGKAPRLEAVLSKYKKQNIRELTMEEADDFIGRMKGYLQKAASPEDVENLMS